MVATAIAATMMMAASGSPTSPGPCPELRGSPAPGCEGAGLAAIRTAASTSVDTTARVPALAAASDDRDRSATARAPVAAARGRSASPDRIDHPPHQPEQHHDHAAGQQPG
jgi:hypothetical protein